jgi:hypothetical protein
MMEADLRQKPELRDNAYFLFQHLLQTSPEAAALLPYADTKYPIVFCSPQCLRSPAFRGQSAALIGQVSNILSGTVYDKGNMLWDLTMYSYQEFQTGVDRKHIKNKQKKNISKPEPGTPPEEIIQEPDFLISETPITEEFLVTTRLNQSPQIVREQELELRLNSAPDALQSNESLSLIEALKVNTLGIKKSLLYAGINTNEIESLSAETKSRLRLSRYILEAAWFGLTRNPITQNLFRGNYSKATKKRILNAHVYPTIESIANKKEGPTLSAHYIGLLLHHISGLQYDPRSKQWKLDHNRLIDFWSYFHIPNPFTTPSGNKIDLSNQASLSQVISSLLGNAACIEIDKTKSDFEYGDRSGDYLNPKGREKGGKGFLSKLKSVSGEESPCYECPLIDYGACARGKANVEKNKRKPKNKKQFLETYQTGVMDWMDSLGGSIKVLLPGGKIITINANLNKIILHNGKTVPIQNLSEHYPSMDYPIEPVNTAIQVYKDENDGEPTISGRAYNGHIANGRKYGLGLDIIPGYEEYGQFIEEVNPKLALGREFLALDPDPTNTYFIKKSPSPGIYIVTEISPDNNVRTFQIYES